MVKKKEYDFLNWTSFPSSGKLFNDDPSEAIWWGQYRNISITPGKTLKIVVNWKQQDVILPESGIRPHVGFWWNGVWGGQIFPPLGTYDWREFKGEWIVPAGKTTLDVIIAGGAGTPEKPGITWFDDLKIYQDDVLIYANDFSNWNPYIGAGVGGGLGGVGAFYLTKNPVLSLGVAALGALVGGGIGALTAKP